MKNAQPNFAAGSGIPGQGAAIFSERYTSHKPQEFDALRQFVSLEGERLVTDTRRVAQHFGKQHKNVLRAFDALDCSANFRRLNFEPTMESVPGPNGATRQERLVRMSKNGFMFLVMGFTGHKAAQIKEAYIGAFDAMAARLHQALESRQAKRDQLAIRSEVSKDKGSFGSGLMHQRRREKHLIEAEIQRLNQPIQMDLLMLEEVQA